MRCNLLFLTLVISLMAVGATAQPPELNAYVSEPVLTGLNCNPTGGPARYSATAYVENNYSTAMSVNYTYFDFPTGVQAEGGRICTVAPNSGEHCTFTIPVRLGGEGSSASELPVILIATLDSDGEVLMARLNFTISHSSTSTEANVLGIIDSAQARLSEQSLMLDSACDAGACCGMVEAKGALDTATSQLAEARSNVRTCSFSDATQSGYAASASLRDSAAAYNANLQACNSSLATYSAARISLTGANNTFYRRAGCGMAVNASRAELANAISSLEQAASLIGSDAYPDAEATLNSTSTSINRSISLSEDCPASSLAPPPEIAATVVPTPAPQQSGTLSKVIGALGYIIIAAIVVVAGAAIYITLGKRKLEGDEGGFNPRQPPPSAPGPEIGVDHSKIDREFHDWLKQAEHEEKKPGPKKGAS